LYGNNIEETELREGKSPVLRHKPNICLSWLAAVLLCGAGLAGQTPSGEIRVTVQDPSGAPMLASVRLSSLSGGATRGFITGAEGEAVLTSLPYGHYRLEISKKDFIAQSFDVDVESAVPITRIVKLALSSQTIKVEVVGSTPLPGSDQSIAEIAAPVQTASQADIAASGALDLSDFLNRRLNGVHLNEVQGNPFQPDLNYRGYTASPLLGTPEGISVYMDGVRLNQPFGDVVSWDLIPRMAISEVALMPGSNPLFGLNTLGGAVSIQTKDGNSQPGTVIEVSGGSYGRRSVEAEHGGSNRHGLNWYVAGNLFHEDGWREYSPSDVRQSFGKLGWQNGSTALSLTVAYADNKLTGNGLQEQRFLARDYASTYTVPDITNNRSPFFNFGARHSVGSAVTLSGTAYFRYIRADTFNADVNSDSLDESVYQPSAADIQALAAAGYTGFPTSGANAGNTPFPSWRCIAQALQKQEPDEKCNGLLTHTFSKQNNYGFSGQATWLGSPLGFRNRVTTGAAYDRSGVAFQQFSQFGYLNPDRSVAPVNAFADGSTNVNGVPYDTRVDLHGRIHTASIFATDTLSLGKAWNITLSGRYNRTVVDNADRIDPGGGPGSLDSHNLFGRFNPSLGVTFNPANWLNAYFSVAEGSRAPTSIELGCADPDIPCKLPNALAGDPPLKQVVTRTWEAGVRGGRESGLHWSAGLFRGSNRDDILFVSSTQTGFGYFKNFGQTRRQGAEFSMDGRLRHISLGGSYTYLQATYQSAETVDGSSNSSSDSGSKGLDGDIQIQPGDRIPLTPRHMGKLFSVVQATAKLSVDLDWVLVSSSYARGNENNQSQPDGQYYLGPGTSPGYGTVNLAAHYRVQRHLQLFLEVNNVLDHRYYTAAQLGPTGFSSTGAFIARPFAAIDGNFPLQHATFYSPGAPRGAWGGIRLQF
jgi:outer membrane receptor protein involved in Fe transport